MESKAIDVRDISYLEKELSRDELISIGFLLYGAENSQEFLNKISEKGEFLEEFAKHNHTWKSKIIEALGIIKNFECIKNLGVEVSEAREFVRKSSSINSGLKLLFELCETISKETSDKLVSYIMKEFMLTEAAAEDQLEIYLLHAIANNKIKITSSLDTCDFSFIHQFKASSNLNDEMFDKLLQKFPSKPNKLDTSNNNSFNISTENNSKDVKIANVNGTTAKTLNFLGDYATRKMLVLIINQQHFTRTTNEELVKMMPAPLSDRKGTGKDMEALKSLFENFNYQVITKCDLPHGEILREIKKVTLQSSKYDGLIVCVLSHGHEGIFYGSDSVPVMVKDVKDIIASKVLLDKPKILLIQACQGDALQKSVTKIVPKTELDGPTQSSVISGSTRADFLIFWSTIEGFASVRHIDNGSWFIQELVKKIQEQKNSQHLMDICVSVIKEVHSKRGYRDECMLPKLESTFTKYFRFP